MIAPELSKRYHNLTKPARIYSACHQNSIHFGVQHTEHDLTCPRFHHSTHNTQIQMAFPDRNLPPAAAKPPTGEVDAASSL